MPEEEIVLVWCVKYALTQGLFKVRGTIRENGWFSCLPYHSSLSPKEWAATLGEALPLAEGLRQKKIKSLKKQLKRIQEMDITAKT